MGLDSNERLKPSVPIQNVGQRRSYDLTHTFVLFTEVYNEAGLRLFRFWNGPIPFWHRFTNFGHSTSPVAYWPVPKKSKIRKVRTRSNSHQLPRAGTDLTSVQRLHIDYKSILHITFDESVVSFVNLLNRNELNV